MKIKVINRQKINSSVKKTMGTVLDCRNWPNFIPTVKKVTILEEKENYMRRVLHSQINGIIIEMETETTYFPMENKIHYRQLRTPWPLKSNEGTWEAKKIGNFQVKLMLTHIFEVKYSLLGYFIGILIIKPFFIYLHNKKDLLLYKKHIESHGQD